MSTLFAWHERGTGVELHGIPGRVRVELVDDGERHSAEFGPALLAALVDQLDGHTECAPAEDLAATEQQLGQAERERDRLADRVQQLEAEAQQRLAEIETLRTALDLADQRARVLEDAVEVEVVVVPS